MNLNEVISMIRVPDQRAAQQCQERWNSIAKPLHSFGKFETLFCQIAGISHSSEIDLSRKALVIFCADNGVVEEGISQSGQEVTAIVAENFLHQMTSVSVMADSTGTDLFAVDIGMVSDTNCINKKIAYGTKNLAKGPAMTREEAVRALEAGIDMAFELKEKGYKIIATGEMGIGNTTTSSAMASVLLNEPVVKMTGKGAGLSDTGLLHKIDVIEKAIALNQPDPADAVDVLAKVGGFDIAGLAGLFLGGAAAGIPVVIDGFISSVAALTAQRIAPASKDYMIASHVSKEPAGRLILEALGLDWFLTCDMCLGEGTGAVLLFPCLDLVAEVYHRMSTFGDIKIDACQEL